MLNFDQVGSRNLDKLPTNSVHWVLAMFGSSCLVLINWVHVTTINFATFW